MLREAMDGEEPTEEDIDHVLGSIAKRRQVEKGPRVGGKKAKAGSRREMKYGNPPPPTLPSYRTTLEKNRYPKLPYRNRPSLRSLCG